ncbi:hypothetical protein KDK_25810 [Dictyobacter kobayashii]|uniref:Uncharacterized protein n=1 Tax=Dictyobacter kobayashii TaxID=2014872 RepID=A0A402AI34_9CHLR|nr:hypothetical protein KDK_25810 [Dictyobacter kobayashii]
MRWAAAAAHLTHSTLERMGLVSLARDLHVCRWWEAAAAAHLTHSTPERIDIISLARDLWTNMKEP